jgi:hypothetical protein
VAVDTVTGWLPEGATEWGGRPIAHRVTDAGPRQRAHLLGVLAHVRACPPARDDGHRGSTDLGAHSAVWLEADLDDGTGVIALRWIGRWVIPGVGPGAILEAEGTVLVDHHRLVMLNPLYEIATSHPLS